MNRPLFLNGILALIVLLSDCSNSADVIVCDPQGCMSEKKLAANIANALGNNVVGYILSVGNGPLIFGDFVQSGGLARTTTDPPSSAPLLTHMIDIASVSKTLTAIAVLKSLANNGILIDDDIWPYIYSDWPLGPNIQPSLIQGNPGITFRQLLTHTSGIRNCTDESYSGLKTLIANGVSLANKIPNYQNCNFALFRELLPVIENDPNIQSLPDQQRAAESANFYINYVNQNVFAPLGIVTRTCASTGDPFTSMLSYPFPAGSTPGTTWPDSTLVCGARGWVLSLSDLFVIVHDLATGNVLLTNAQKAQMNSNCLGWDCSVRSDCPSPYVCKNGGLHNTPGVDLHSYIGVLKCTVPVIVIVNSTLPAAYQPWDTNGNLISGKTDIIGLVNDAYNGALVSGASQPCP